MFISRIQTPAFRKIKHVFTVCLIIFASLTVSLLTQTITHAKMDTGDLPADRAKSYSYWKAASKCVTSHMRGTIKTQIGANGDTRPQQGGGDGEWFDDFTAWVTVYPDGKLDCDQVMTKALALWGWSDYKQFLRDMGYTFNSDIPEWTRKNDSSDSRFEAFKDAVLEKVGNVVNLFNGSAKYDLYLGIFTTSKSGLGQCNAKRVVSPDRTQRDAAKENKTIGGLTYTIIKFVNGEKVTDTVYTYSKQTPEGMATYASTWNYRGSNYPGGTGEHFSCQQLVGLINDNANSFAAWNMQSDVDQDTGAGAEEDTSGCVDDCETEAAPSCLIDGVGWILCPILTFMGGVTDGAYSFVSSLLEVQPLEITGSNEGLFGAWSTMRNLANIAFVIAFLFIIFSQLTGVGVSNYGVKKLLPRLVIAAILVNVSYWICAIAVDLSNIIGAGIVNAFNSIGTSIRIDELDAIENELGTGGGWMALVGTVIAGGVVGTAVFYVGLSALIPALIAALLAIVTVFLVLTLRQALIILLIAVSPLAFVAYLLPNTEDWFTRWRKLLTTLLLMYPIIAGIFGASALASKIIMTSAHDDNWVVQIMGALIAILPLAITPVVMQTAGGILNRFAGIVNNRERGPADRLRNMGNKYRERRQNIRNARALNGQNQLGRGAFVRWRARRNAIGQNYEAESKRANTEYIAGQMQNNSGFRNAAAGGQFTGLSNVPAIGKMAEKTGLSVEPSAAATQRVLATAISAQDKLEADEVSAASIVLKDARLDQAELRILSGGGVVKGLDASQSVAMRSAAIQAVVKSNDVAQMNKLWDDSRNWQGEDADKLRQVLADNIQSSPNKPSYYGQGAIANLRLGKHASAEDTIIGALEQNAYSPAKLAPADKDELGEVLKVIGNAAPGKIAPSVVENLKQNVSKVFDDDRLSVQTSKNRTALEKIRDLQVSHTATGGSDDAPTVKIETRTVEVDGSRATQAPQTQSSSSQPPQSRTQETYDPPTIQAKDQGTFTIDHAGRQTPDIPPRQTPDIPLNITSDNPGDDYHRGMTR